MQCGNIASRTNGAGYIYIRSTHVPYIYINILGGCSALWGKREGVVWCTAFHIHTCIHIGIISLI